jgi:DNA-binding winged helix-turn-helix (wHTH) protein
LDGAADKVVLREQPFQVLRMLVVRNGKIVTRSEIKKRLWPTIVDHDHIINVATGVLRRALGDSADDPRYVETLARRGYPPVAGDGCRSRRHEPFPPYGFLPNRQSIWLS